MTFKRPTKTLSTVFSSTPHYNGSKSNFMKNSKQSKPTIRKPSYGEPFADPKYLQRLIAESPSMPIERFFSSTKEGVYFLRLPLVAIMGYMSVLETKESKERRTIYRDISKECQRLTKHVESLIQFVKAYEATKVGKS